MRPTRPTRPSRISGNDVHSHAPDIDPNPPEEPADEFDYDKDLHIDPNYLDAEFLNHAQIFMKYCRESARANKAAKIAEEKVKTTRSELIKQAKESGEKYTETTLEAYYRLDPKYVAAKTEWINATFYADLLVNAVFAFQARKSALENLVRLHGQEYFSTPQEPRDLPEAAARLEELKNTSAVNSIKRRMQR